MVFHYDAGLIPELLPSHHVQSLASHPAISTWRSCLLHHLTLTPVPRTSLWLTLLFSGLDHSIPLLLLTSPGSAFKFALLSSSLKALTADLVFSTASLDPSFQDHLLAILIHIRRRFAAEHSIKRHGAAQYQTPDPPSVPLTDIHI
jgi:hypothetical protein